MAESVFMAAQNSDLKFELCRKASFSRIVDRRPSRLSAARLTGDDPATQAKKEKMWKMMESYLPNSSEVIQQNIVNHIEYTLARTRFNFSNDDCYRATAYSIRDRLIEALNDTVQLFFTTDAKRCYYLSMEFLLGRAMQNALANLDIEGTYKEALNELGFNLEELYEYEHDPALGNGGLGRLAACFLDSMATLNLPCWGYGIRYTYGIFEQKIVDGRQVEYPDYWLVMDNPWEICRHDITYAIRFYGNVTEFIDENTKQKRFKWTGGQIVQAVAYDNPIPGFDTYNCMNLRLWKAIPSREFDFKSFNAGHYLEAVAERQSAESISSVLYPNDNTYTGKLLRLQQQYFFVCATIQDVLRRFRRRNRGEKPGERTNWTLLPEKLAIQLNDTHPTVAIPELMRILMDIEGMTFDQAWSITRQVFNYTNHTVLPEALEKWPVSLFESLLPRHLLIINEINFSFLNEVRNVWPNDCEDRVMRMSIYEEGSEKRIRMANLAVIGSKKVNGVAALHTEILRKTLFKDFLEFYAIKGDKNKFINLTNGVTPRRWIHVANRQLSNLFSSWLGSDVWLKNLQALRELEHFKNDPKLVKEWTLIKLENKRRLAEYVKLVCHTDIYPEEMLFDVHVKRLHEYKRQLLNLLYIIHRYLTIKKLSEEERKRSIQPRACLIGGKAAPGYHIAKSIIKLCCNMSEVINNDPDTSHYLKVCFLPNYNVSNATLIIPGSDICHQISTAGMEASGTSNMKFVLNGCLIIGTLDGANVEILEECGPQVMFCFGAKEHEVSNIRQEAADGSYPIDKRLEEVFHFIKNGNLSLNDQTAQHDFNQLIDGISSNGSGHVGDYYLVIYDFPDFCKAQEDLDTAYMNQQQWTKTCIECASRMGKFSSDRTILEYTNLVWNIEPSEREAPTELLPKVNKGLKHPKMIKSDKSSKSSHSNTSQTVSPGPPNIQFDQ